jgi:nicotinamide mononucleotide transporter
MLGLEIFGSISVLLCVYLTVKQNVLCWSVGILGCIAYFIIFYSSQLYGESFLQIVFIIQSLYGWYYWKKKEDVLNITTLNTKTFITHIVILLVTYFLLTNLTILGSLDTMITLISLLATYYLTKKYLESWMLWITVDVLSVLLLLGRELYISAILYFILLILATSGLLLWRKNLKTV